VVLKGSLGLCRCLAAPRGPAKVIGHARIIFLCPSRNADRLYAEKGAASSRPGG
jgi:hypothetical protein